MSTINDLITEIKQSQQEIAESMVNGNCINFESYQRLVGQYMGLGKSLDILNNLMKEREKDVE
jgi:hypothetical protein